MLKYRGLDVLRGHLLYVVLSSSCFVGAFYTVAFKYTEQHQTPPHAGPEGTQNIVARIIIG